MESNQAKAACCGQPSRTGKAFTCLPNWVFGQTTANEKAVLLTLQFHAPNIHPSLSTLARESGLSQRTVQRVLSELEAKGWVAKEETTTASGGKGSNRYQLLIWRRPETENSAKADEAPHWPQSPEAMDTVTRGVWTQWPGGMDTVANKQEQSNKINLLTREEPPLPPAAQGERASVEPGPYRDEDEQFAASPDRDRDGFLIHPSQLTQPQQPPQPEQPTAMESTEPPAATQPQPEQPNAPRPLPEPAPDPEASTPVKPKTRKREAGFVPTADDVPAALLPVFRELLAFWPARKGAKTLAAWELLCSELQRIQDHPQGGTEIVRGQLEQGATAGIDGKAWQSIRFANWERYGTKAATPVMGTGFRGRRTTMERVMGAIALVEDRERKAAAAQQVEIGGLVLAEVA